MILNRQRCPKCMSLAINELTRKRLQAQREFECSICHHRWFEELRECYCDPNGFERCM